MYVVAVGLCMQEEACYADCHFMVDQSSMHLYFCITSHATYFLILWPQNEIIFCVTRVTMVRVLIYIRLDCFSNQFWCCLTCIIHVCSTLTLIMSNTLVLS